MSENSPSINDFFGTMQAMTKAMNRLADELAAARGGSTGKSSTGSSEGKTSTGKKGPTIEDVQKQFSAFMSVGDKELKDERGTWLKKLTKKYGVARISEVTGDDIAKVLNELKKRLESEKAAEDSSDDGDGDSEEDII